MASQPSALTVVERVEQSPAVMLLDARSQTLVDLLPDAAAVSRFKRVVVQALTKNPDLLECTPESVVLSVFEAAAQGLEPTGAAGGAHLVPYNVKVSKNPERWEKRAQLIPDYRGVIRLVTQPPSEVVSLEARVVKEGDEFDYQLGTDAFVRHTPSLAPGRSERATTHVYAIARLKGGASIPDVEDRAGIERIRKRARGDGFSPWATDWDEMGKKTIIKRIAKVLPVRPEIRSILVREDELADSVPQGDEETAKATGPTKVARMAARLSRTPAEPSATTDEVEGDASWIDDVVEASAEAELDKAAETVAAAVVSDEAGEQTLDLATSIRAAAAASDHDGPVTKDDLMALGRAFAGWDAQLVKDGIRVLWGREAIGTPTSAQAHALVLTADSLADGFKPAWESMVAAQAVAA